MKAVSKTIAADNERKGAHKEIRQIRERRRDEAALKGNFLGESS